MESRRREKRGEGFGRLMRGTGAKPDRWLVEE